ANRAGNASFVQHLQVLVRVRRYATYPAFRTPTPAYCAPQGLIDGTRNVNANGLSNLTTLRQLLVALPLLAFAACQSAPGSVQFVNESAPIAATSTDQVPKPSPSIAILVSRNLPVYTDVAT